MFKHLLLIVALVPSFCLADWKVPGSQISVEVSATPFTLQSAIDANVLFDPFGAGGLEGDFLLGTNITSMVFEDGEWRYGMAGTNIVGLTLDGYNWVGLTNYLYGTNIVGASFVANEWVLDRAIPFKTAFPTPKWLDETTAVPQDVTVFGAGVRVDGGADPWLMQSSFTPGSGVFVFPADGLYNVQFKVDTYLAATGTVPDVVHYSTIRTFDTGLFSEQIVTDVVATVYQWRNDNTTNLWVANWSETEFYKQGDEIKFAYQNFTTTNEVSGTGRYFLPFLHVDYLGAASE